MSFDIFKSMVHNLVEDMIDIDDKVRKESGMPPSGSFEAVPEEQTEEEALAIAEAEKAKKEEALKKQKGAKPKTEEEEAAELAAHIQKSSIALASTLSKPDSEKIISAEKEIELIKTRWLMQNHLKMDPDMYDQINRKLSLFDIDISSKDLVLRLDLDVPLSKFTAPVGSYGKESGKTSDVGTHNNKQSNANMKTVSENQSAVSISPLGEQENWWKGRVILDNSWVKRVVAELRYCMDKMANRIFVIGNLGERHGKIKGENSMKIIQTELQKHI